MVYKIEKYVYTNTLQTRRHTLRTIMFQNRSPLQSPPFSLIQKENEKIGAGKGEGGGGGRREDKEEEEEEEEEEW